MNPHSIVISSTDLERLEEYLYAGDCPGVLPGSTVLRAVLNRARVVAPYEVPSNIVAMNSTFIVEDKAGTEYQRTLVYPDDTQSTGSVCIFDINGSVLLGLEEGQKFSLAGEQGAPLEMRVKCILGVEAHRYIKCNASGGRRERLKLATYDEKRHAQRSNTLI